MADEIRNSAKLWITYRNLPADWQDDEQLDEAVRAALLRYDRDAPQETQAAFPGTGAAYYDLSDLGLTGWAEGTSVVTEVEYPYTLGGTEDNTLELDAWDVQEDPTNGKTLIFQDGSVPAATETVRIVFNAPFTESTVPANHVGAVGRLTAANFCRMLATRRAQANVASLSADATTGGTESDQWLKLAERFERQYEEELGLGGSADTAGGSDLNVSAGVGIISIDPGSGDGLGKMHPYHD